MVACNKLVEFLLVFYFAVSCTTNTYAQYVAPKPQIEALEKGGFRVYIPAIEGAKQRFKFFGSKNEDLSKTKVPKFAGETSTPVDGVLMLQFDEVLRVGDTINYKIHVDIGDLGYRREGLSWTVEKKDLKDEYTPLGPSCIPSSTTVNGQTSCTDRLILSDDFAGPSINTDKWIIEHMIPTYEPPNYEFNSYENIDSTRFIRDGVLYLKPNLIPNESDIRRVLDLRNGCTGTTRSECYYRPVSAFYAPPIKSARITSKVSFKYGKIEIRAKLPAGDWIFPVIELQMKEKVWGTSSPKVKIAYSRGNDRLVPIGGGEDIGSRVLYAGPALSYQEPGRSNRLKKRVDDTPYHNAFHDFKFEWVPGKMSFYIDNSLFGEVSTLQGFEEFKNTSSAREAPYDREYVLTLGVGAGGIYDFPDEYASGESPKPWRNDERNYLKSFFDTRGSWSRTWNENRPALQIDSVKITAL